MPSSVLQKRNGPEGPSNYAKMKASGLLALAFGRLSNWLALSYGLFGNGLLGHLVDPFCYAMVLPAILRLHRINGRSALHLTQAPLRAATIAARSRSQRSRLDYSQPRSDRYSSTYLSAMRSTVKRAATAARQAARSISPIRPIATTASSTLSTKKPVTP